MERTILHVDINNCYASIECLHNPSLAGKPVAVGGNAEERHGIILAKNYQARDYGVKVGQALWEAREKCPNLIILPPNYELYLKYSGYIREIFNLYTDMVEPFGIDEAWLDVSGSRLLFGSGPKIADEIRRRVKSELGVTVSVGVSFNKVFAKLGSDMKKPDAVTVLDRNNYKQLVWPLPVGDLLYVGSATKRKLYSKGVRTIGELAEAGPERLGKWLGKWGYTLYAFAHGDDLSPVARAGSERVIKSIGNSITAPRDILNMDEAKTVFFSLSESVAARLREHALKGGKVQISLRRNDLGRIERQMKLAQPTSLSCEICAAATALLAQNYNWERPLRGMGIRLSELVPENSPCQLSMLVEHVKREKSDKLERCIDKVRGRFGYWSIARGTALADKALSGAGLFGCTTLPAGSSHL